MNQKEWQERFTEEYGTRFSISAAAFEEMLRDVRTNYHRNFFKGYAFGMLVGVFLGAALMHI